MQGIAALSIFALLLICFLYRDSKRRPMRSWGMWVVLVWMLIIGSRPVGYWLEGGDEPKDADFYLDGSPLDRNTFLVLILLAALALWRRRPPREWIFQLNRCFFVFLIYCALSISWSDFPFVSTKRYVKEIGNIIMILIIMSEAKPIDAIRALLARCTYLLLPLSLICIYYFPTVGVYYNVDLLEASYRGVQVEKNFFGLITFVCGMFMMWELLHPLRNEAGKVEKIEVLSRLALVGLAIYLLSLAGSSTATACMALGTLILVAMKLPSLRRQARHLGAYAMAVAVALLFLYCVPGVLDAFTGMLGRNSTLTGRTEIWEDLLGESINPLVGAGYQGFWLGSRMEYYFDKYIFHLNQAHNGYLEAYLNGGVLGLFLLLALLVATGAKVKRVVLQEEVAGSLLLAFYIVALFYNWTEAVFGKLNISWFTLALAALYGPPPQASECPAPAAPANAAFARPARRPSPLFGGGDGGRASKDGGGT